MAIKRTYCCDLLSIIRLNCPDQIEFIEANFTAIGAEAIIKDKYDGQIYKLNIEPAKNLNAP